MRRRILLIDNLDSFTFNLVDALERLGAEVTVLRNRIAAGEAMAIAERMEALILLSPGPGGPQDAGCCLELTALAKGVRPLLGICLGHQVIAAEAGGAVVRAPAPVHGKPARVEHNGSGAFAGLPSPLTVGRYHSLAVADLPPRLRVTARCGPVIMACEDPAARQIGLQFHPESILTPLGDRILANVLAMSGA
jgi:anthranilate synthase component II